MPRLLSYAEAATLLGGGKSPVVTALDRITDGILLGATPLAPAVLGWFDAKAEFVRLSHDLVRTFQERRSGLSRYTRTQRLHAAHTVLVVTAFFEAVAAADTPYRFDDLELTRDEQLLLTSAGQEAASLAEFGGSAPVPLPASHESSEDFQARLGQFYLEFAARFHRFVAALAMGETLATADAVRIRQLNECLTRAALTRYDELLNQLSRDFPEVAWWLSTREHRATRAGLREVGTALAEVERMLVGITTGAAADARRMGLARSYQAALGRAVAESGDTPRGIRLPTLDEAYIEPLYRVAAVESAVLASDHGWWEQRPLRDQLARFLSGYLTSPQASLTPLLVLGEPGSGKSVLTKVLAARLPAADFLPVRVVLRDVPAQADLQDQIEYAIRDAIGERLPWPDLARSAPQALPVVILDGFDELLQATGVSQTDYLIKVARFQEREAIQGRPVAVLVTSRTSVADRAQPPQDTIALRLEPFDDDRIAAWLARWNAVNAQHFATTGLTPFLPEVALAHRDLASQPLLLLMLALYDAPANALQNLAGVLGEGDLYERLLIDFCEREVTKHRAGMSQRELYRAIEEELRHLSVVSFGMFNRGAQWITETDLDADLKALIGPRAQPTSAATMRTPLGAAESLLGRFFFMHRSQASRDSSRLETYEFLHATFGEYLVARFTWRVLLDTAAREAASTLRLAASVDDDLLHAMLSFAAICVRAPVVDFLREMAARLDEDQRAELTEFLLRLFHAVHDPRPARAYAGYQPRPLRVPSRHAAYSANLVVLAVCVAGQILASELYPEPVSGGDPVGRWHGEALLWRSQLSGENWSRMVDTLRVERFWNGGRRDLRLSVDDGSEPTPVFDPMWTYQIKFLPYEGEEPSGTVWSHHDSEVLRRKAHFQCGNLDDVVHHALEPLLVTLPEAVNTMIGWNQTSQSSLANLLLGLWLAPLGDHATPAIATTARKAAAILASAEVPLQGTTRYAVTRLLLDAVTVNQEIPAAVVAEVLERVPLLSPVIKRGAARCALAHLGRDQDADRRIAAAVVELLPADQDQGDPVLSELAVRLMELRPS